MNPPTPPPYQPHPPYPVARTSGLAITSLVCGILGFVTIGLTGLVAIVTGHIALSSIKRSGGAVGGRGFAIAGLVTGYFSFFIIGLAMVAGLAAPVILKQRHAADRMECMAHTRQLALALDDFKTEYKSLPADALAASEPKFAGLTGPRVLDQVEAAGLVPEVDTLLAMRSSYKGDWYYFPGADPASPEAPVLVSPAIGDRHVLYLVDGSSKVITTSAFSAIDLSKAIAIPAPAKKK